MKKVVFFLLVTLAFTNVEAQTYEQTQRKTSKEISRLNTCLNQVKDKIYYFKVTLGEKLNDKAFIKKQSPSYLNDLRKDSLFSKESLDNLNFQKTEIENTLKELTEISLSSTEDRIGTDAESNIPEKMGRRELKMRTRAQLFKFSENTLNGKSKDCKLAGILVNYKTGVNEIATFKITRIGFSEFPAIVKALDPKERVTMTLPVGEYNVEIDCGNYHKTVKCSVDPRVTKRCDQQEVYWFACKLMSDF